MCGFFHTLFAYLLNLIGLNESIRNVCKNINLTTYDTDKCIKKIENSMKDLHTYSVNGNNVDTNICITFKELLTEKLYILRTLLLNFFKEFINEIRPKHLLISNSWWWDRKDFMVRINYINELIIKYKQS